MSEAEADEIGRQVRRLLARCTEQSRMVATAESCTGGMIAAALTDIAGSSAMVDRGFVTYSNEAKSELLGVPMEMIEANGAVSAPVARAMVIGALDQSKADIAVAVTGIAGPDGGTVEKPVGLVYLASAERNGEVTVKEERFGDIGRGPIRSATVLSALQMLLDQTTTP